jgi:hypothetical protein
LRLLTCYSLILIVSTLKGSLLNGDHVSFGGLTAELVKVLGHEVHIVWSLLGDLFDSDGLLGWPFGLGLR